MCAASNATPRTFKNSFKFARTVRSSFSNSFRRSSLSTKSSSHAFVTVWFGFGGCNCDCDCDCDCDCYYDYDCYCEYDYDYDCHCDCDQTTVVLILYVVCSLLQFMYKIPLSRFCKRLTKSHTTEGGQFS